MKPTCFANCRLCINGELIEKPLLFSPDTRRILDPTDISECKVIDLEGAIIAPGFLELQTNGMLGFHFTNHEDDQQYQTEIDRVARYLLTKGVTAFWATVPTVPPEDFQRILPSLKPRACEGGADLLGAHVEGPYLAPSKKGAHDASLFLDGSSSLARTYGEGNLDSSVKLATIAPETSGAMELISHLSEDKNIKVSLGHSSADYDTGAAAIKAGAKSLTHVFNAMDSFHHRTPVLASLIGSSLAPYYSMIPDGIHLHPTTLTIAYRTNPKRCILITDSVELAGLPDGVYPGHAQIRQSQRKTGNRVTIDGTDTLIGSCCSLDECVRNLVSFSGCTLAEAVRCVTENVAALMDDSDRGVLEAGRRADLVVLTDSGEVLQTWSNGLQVYRRA